MNARKLAPRMVLFLVVMLSAAVSPAQQSKRPASPIEPINAILDAFRSHAIVALGEGNHNNEQGHAFRLSLIRDPRFAATVNDIVVEFGNARYQDLMDRFIRGENVPTNLLRQVWQNTTQPHAAWDVPIYEEFFRAVRGVNASLPKQLQLRVLLGDPPIDWDSERSVSEQVRDVGTRDGFPAQIVWREVLAKRRRALLIYGDGHFARRPESPRNVVDLLESTGTKVFTIHTNAGDADLEDLQPNISKWPEPSLALIRGTVLELAPFRSDPSSVRSIVALDGKFDALLYLGHPLTITYARFTSGLCGDTEYIRMRTQRMRNPKWESQFLTACKSPLPILPKLWRTYQAKGIAAALALAPAASAAYPDGANELYRLAQTLMKRRKVDDAIAVLEKNVQLFPRNVPSYNHLSEAYAIKGDALLALKSHQQALTIDRSNKTARNAFDLNH